MSQANNKLSSRVFQQTDFSWRGFASAVICVVKTKQPGKQKFVFLNATAPVYLSQPQQHNQTEYQFFRIINQEPPSSSKSPSTPSSVLETCMISAPDMATLQTMFTFKDVTMYASRNDALMVYYCLLRYES